LAASTPIPVSDNQPAPPSGEAKGKGRTTKDAGRTPPVAAAPVVESGLSPSKGSSSPRSHLTAARIGLAVVSLVAIAAFAAYAALLASQVDEVTEPVPITVPSKGATTPVVGGNVAPNFTLPSLDGQAVSLSDFAGRPVWINVWASWCAPCRAEMPDINTVYQEVRAKQSSPDQGPALLTVSIGEDPAAVRKYLDSTQYHLLVLVDPTFDITEQYRITGLPTHYFIGADGVIHDFHIGPLKPAAMRSMLAKITTAGQ
jgi:thiol-disulfide isomerase/thioredoxin